mmetsp:Transcript_1860/g.2399  ORF Transcript_1860/g.2399 Transcript_1860/m.2399 type:complete len:292 (-) Transcript_1860:421-1296(-)|eukprot:CAMPEP_0204827678 /NCGR_PEP_ID=MMETSP1346-20131115/5118_1 /ASSEMBLY_ACC=CAM_ASM_000771 /TAXON_ID=215587 /ORGANISM="Aplanochytrium stocchinoi, Strain GSBS06" /LENGTH=291 /DNA_ID=CAMNT_0051956193 /DNA_START=77 /DNA_END=949 /DNA_ORIENTATION=-
MRQRRGTKEANQKATYAVEKKESSWKGKFAFVRPSDNEHYNFVCSIAVLIAMICLIAENISPTAYGRFGNDDVVFAVSPRVGWWLMELPVTVMFVYFFFIKGGSQSHNLVPRIMALVICGHYAYRGWYYPYNIKVSNNSKNFSLAPAVGGWLVTTVHGYLNAKWFAEHGKHLNRVWLKSARFWIGLAVYYSGFAMLVWHDKLMRDLRNTPGPRYRIPVGGMFDYATCAHYFAELWAWLGFAILSWGPNGVFIFTVSFVNLVPRAVGTHSWYLEKFGDEYPADRQYMVPFVW